MPDEWMTGQELMDAYGLTVTEIAKKFFYERGKPFWYDKEKRPCFRMRYFDKKGGTYL